MIKRTTNLILVLIICVVLYSATGIAVDAAQFTYDADAALHYAAAHWNDGVGECAEFVSRCVIAGGINISKQVGTGPCYRAIGSATGLGPSNVSENNSNLPSLPSLILDSKGNANIASNKDILSAGDVVIQWCYTHQKSPHMLICSGFDLNGNAKYYAHNNALNDSRYNLSYNRSNNHTAACNMGAKVIHLTGSGVTQPVYPPTTPAGLIVSKASNTSAALSWKGSAGVDYVVEYKTHGNPAEWVPDRDYAGGTSYISRGLSRFDIWEYRVMAINTAGKSNWAFITYTKPNSTPTPPPPVQSYTITYDANSGVGAPSKQTFTSGSSVKLSSTVPTKSEYEFTHWTTTGTVGSPKYDAGGTYSFNGDITLYAMWRTTFTLTYDANGGTGAPPKETRYSDGPGWKTSSVIPTRSGYTFMGWGAAPATKVVVYTAGSTISGERNVTIYAVWKEDVEEPIIPPDDIVVDFYSFEAGWIQIQSSADTSTADPGKLNVKKTYGCKSTITFNGKLDSVEFILYDGNKKQIAQSTDNTSKMRYEFHITSSSGVSYNYLNNPNNKTGYWTSDTPILATLQNGKTYYWKLVVTNGGKKFESPMQSFTYTAATF
jgi:Listeria/Bacterioides repeat